MASLKHFSYHHLVVAMFAVFAQEVWADTTDETETDTELGTMTVTVDATKKAQVGETLVSRDVLNTQNIQNAQDLVRYNTEVDVAEVGRYGNKGFAIRGVDGNRVAMNIDGVALPEVEVNEIFAPYGYQYEGRFNPDLEMMGGVRIAAGSDSLLSGSGAVGGSVSYSTKEPRDLLQKGNPIGGYAKVGYTNKNDEWLTAAGLAAEYGKFEFLINYAHRKGHELKNHDMKSHDGAKLDPMYLFPAEYMPGGPLAPNNGDTASLIYPDTLEYQSNSVLPKLYYHINDEHRIGFHGFYQKRENHMNIDSKNVTNGSRRGLGIRRAHDVEELKSYGISYRYSPIASHWLNQLDVGYTHSKTLGLADTWLYDRTFNDDNTAVLSSTLSEREYRPVNTDTDQVTLDLHALPIDFGKFGEHRLFFQGKYAKQDYTSTAHYLSYRNGEYNADGSFVNYSFTDAKKDIYSFTLRDNVYFSDRFKASVGVRYDNLKYQPYFQSDTVGTQLTSLTEEAKAYGTCVSNNASSIFCDAYRAGTHNQTSKFDHLTWNAMLDYELIADKLTARYKVGTGFLAPTVTQIYSNFTINANEQVPNYHLKPETSLSHELEFAYKPTDNTTLTLGGYITKYDDFIHTKYWNSNRWDKIYGCNYDTCLQSVNLDEAEIKGLKFGVKADLTDWAKLNGRVDMTADYHFSKDKALVTTDYDGVKEVNTLAAVPGMFVAGLNYYSPNDDWEIHAKVRWTQAKRASDAKYLDTKLKYKESKVWCNDSSIAGYCDFYGSWYGFTEYDPVKDDYYKIDRVTDGYSEEVKTYDVANRSKSTFLLDIYGSKRFGRNKNFILNAGVYNITNEKYIPWETLRQFASTSVNSMVDKEGYGFNRYTAPGRNYALSLTYEF